MKAWYKRFTIFTIAWQGRVWGQKLSKNLSQNLWRSPLEWISYLEGAPGVKAALVALVFILDSWEELCAGSDAGWEMAFDAEKVKYDFSSKVWTLSKCKGNFFFNGFFTISFLRTSCVSTYILRKGRNPSQESSIGSISAWHRGGPKFQSRQGQEFFSENQ